ncbi:AGE family epimerase/isomerase, partial [Burkholderia anthina]|uniref:AGE family epimerase/isomerase n=1 Tax=Burkholderia anthina TaxID=179879 RepID=UPI0021BC0FE8
MSAPDSASAQAAQLRDHFAHVILPIWQGSGFDHTLRLPFEAVDPATHAPLHVTRYRAMACARQLFVFAQAGNAAHAATLFDSLCSRFRDPRHGGWFYSVDAQGAPLDTTKDLYTHAFIVFACAAWHAASGDAAARTIAEDTAALIQDRFAPQPGGGGGGAPPARRRGGGGRPPPPPRGPPPRPPPGPGPAKGGPRGGGGGP